MKSGMKVVKVIAALVAGSVLLAGVTSQAIPAVNGMIAFKGTATVNSSGVTSWYNTEVAGVIGFGGVSVGDAVNMASWSFNSGSVSSLWKAQGYNFDLISSAVVFKGAGAVLVNGVGTISGNGYNTTYGTWTFYSKIPNNGSITTPIFSFTVAGCPVQTTDNTPGTSVPDGGTTLILLGLAFSVVAVLRGILRKGIA
jgi:hypothetical protein